ncbi:MAG: leucine-rich repeat domain-containing protein [Gammaproteobacteria bacterium]|nr:leucine-rich repeat domain-containing protein [Gammaproteobacteria bacterium]
MTSIVYNFAIFAYSQLGDLDGDSRADLLYRHDGGSFACKLEITPNEQFSNYSIPGIERDKTWHVAIQADLDGDGKSDLLLRNTEGMWEYIPMDGCELRGEDRSIIPPLAEHHWRIVVALDIDDDGHDELFWRNEDGQWMIQYMDGGVVRVVVEGPEGLPPNSDWQFVGSGYLDSDEFVDLVLRHRDGTWLRTWPVLGEEVTFSSKKEPFIIDPSWREEVIADFDGDDIDELLLRHADGTWKVQSLSSDEDMGILQWDVATLPTSWKWQIEGIGDLDGDNESELLIRGPLNEWLIAPVRRSETEDNSVELGTDPQRHWQIPNPPIYIPDKILRQSIESALRLSDDTWIFRENMLSLVRLSNVNSFNQTASLKISNLRGLHYARRLNNLNLLNHGIINLSPLIGLESITSVTLGGNEIHDFSPLAYLTTLTSLFLDNNQIDDVSSLSHLINLRTLRLSRNQISDISGVETLINVTSLSLFDNRITDLSPLKNLVNLRTLFLGTNAIIDISTLEHLTNLQELTLYANQISELRPLGKLTELKILQAQINEISSLVGLEELTNLERLYIFRNKISDLSPLENLTNLTVLNLGENQITDVQSLSSLINLTTLYLNTNQITDISPLVDLKSLQVLGIGSNDITDISTLKSLEQLRVANVSRNSVKVIEDLGDLPNLRLLNLSNNQITDITGLSDLVSLQSLDLSQNLIEDVSPLRGLTNLNELNLRGNLIKEIASLDGMIDLDELDLSFNPLAGSANVVLEKIASYDTDIKAMIFQSFTDSRATNTDFAYVFGTVSDDPNGVLVFFHGNDPGTRWRMVERLISSVNALASKHGLVGVLVTSPEGGNTLTPWQEPKSSGDGIRYFNYHEDIDLLHELLQSDFDGLIKVDTDRVFLYGKSQGTCFLNRFVSRWGSYYGGGLLADCGCSEGLDPLLRANPDDFARMRVFVRAPTGDFLHNLSRQAYGYYKYVVGLDTRSDLKTSGGHCSRGGISDDDALSWLRGVGTIDEPVNKAHVTRVASFDRIVGLASDVNGGIWVVQQRTGPEPLASLWRSVDRGDSFEYVRMLEHAVFDLDIVEDRLFLTTSDGPILRSEDLGQTFQSLDLDQSVANGLIALPSLNESLGRLHALRTPALLGTHGGRLLVLPRDEDQSRIYMSTDLGATWTEHDVPSTRWRSLYPDPINLDADEWYLTMGRPPLWLTEDDEFSWHPVNSPPNEEEDDPLRSTAWSGTELLANTVGYGSLWSSSDLGHRWQEKTLPESAQLRFGAIASADLTSVMHGDVLLVGGGRDAHIYNGQINAWTHIYGSGGIGITSGYLPLPHKVAVDPVRRDIYITDSRGLFRIDARFRPSESGEPVFDDVDDDGIPDALDRFPEDSSEYLDTDSDGIGNSADEDDDGDGTEDSLDGSPLDLSENSDLDGDGIGDRHDNDSDGDKVADVLDQFPSGFSESLDQDGDGIGNWEDLDDDNDGVDDRVDAFPLYPGESADTDGDLVGDNIDPDVNESTFDSINHLSPASGSWGRISAKSIAMTLSKPPELHVPEYGGGTSFYGSLALGNADQSPIQLMLVTFEGTETPILYMDRNGDNDLTNDGSRLHLVNTRHRTLEPWYRSWVEVSYQSGITLPYYLYLSVRLNQNGETASLSYGANGRVLSWTLPDQNVIHLVVVDRDGDALFNGSDDFFCVDLNRNRNFEECHHIVTESPSSERFSIGESFTLGNSTYTPQISPSGYKIEFETEENSSTSARSNMNFEAGLDRIQHPAATKDAPRITEDSFYDPLIEYGDY